ncbi:bifunctional D-glycero-beta-D-manno-heptose-7-phosphate kinase/D-glycero-beta-D-manno-heptose 1-phosphate adenylyltransferase HldE [Methylococcus geothermalis]|uniref:Bifunctional protein HldE n=1 Tax=Methylococcus geothermalis TaxID=2681310 RepID=A0A858Q8X6_9GAMM|nr:bifunctional D-glycero-beta-D-manno-heptose-7-phosphate kinase/D-glycero-beta-D-manno-heptose 1-phosphate adenylyltransferase HldE [Methylococcus geothermalis]QJD30352.1 bifunctional D-glycero-beta-D-manno-heptose-7-phosphate kinase/D-glycero-beta-D-manno-heptose 1-phosphate adenylyltransferase HldE [Methylococcus geothermalis]
MILPDFSLARVVVVGDLMLDRYWFGGTSRISPEAPVPVVRVENVEERIGGAGNVALNLAALGGTVDLLGYAGEDEAADVLASLLTAAGIRSHIERVPTAATVTKLRIISRQQQLIRLDFEGGFGHLDPAVLVARFRALLAEAGVVVLSDYAKGTLASVHEFIAAARCVGIPVLVDPKGRDFECYRGASLLTPNLAEFEAVVGACRDDAAIERKGLELIAGLDLGALLVTRGEHGMSLLEPAGGALHLPAHAKEVYDVTGAGDTVISVLAAALAAGRPLPEAVALANLAAGIVVGKLGTAAVSPEELAIAIHGQRAPSRGAIKLAELLDVLDPLRRAGERIVVTNGCFDLLHPGHVHYLEQARALGDRLIVLVNGDDSVRRLKGAGRPVNPLAHRMAMLAALESVDWVVAFEGDTPRDEICAIRPDVLVKGGDYRDIAAIAGHDCVLAAGGEVRVLDFVDGHSTTRLIETIRNG